MREPKYLGRHLAVVGLLLLGSACINNKPAENSSPTADHKTLPSIADLTAQSDVQQGLNRLRTVVGPDWFDATDLEFGGIEFCPEQVVQFPHVLGQVAEAGFAKKGAGLNPIVLGVAGRNVGDVKAKELVQAVRRALGSCPQTYQVRVEGGMATHSLTRGRPADGLGDAVSILDTRNSSRVEAIYLATGPWIVAGYWYLENGQKPPKPLDEVLRKVLTDSEGAT